MKIVFIGSNEFFFEGFKNSVECLFSNGNKEKSEIFEIEQYRNMSDFIEHGNSVLDINFIIYDYDALSTDSLVFLQSVKSIKKIGISIIANLNHPVSRSYIDQLYRYGLDYIVDHSESKESIINTIGEFRISGSRNGKSNSTSSCEKSSTKQMLLGDSDDKSILIDLALQWAKSERKKRLLEALAQGYKNEEISLRSNLSIGTVRNYVSKLMLITNIDNRTKLALLIRKRISESNNKFKSLF